MTVAESGLVAVLDYIRANHERFVSELSDLCAMESVSAWGRSLEQTAEAVGQSLERAGAKVSIVKTSGQPIVVGKAEGGSDRTIVFYDHYDVQPPDPLEQWTAPPFEPAVRDGCLFARGTADNKGNLMARVQAVEAWNRAGGGLPISVVFIVEGEEETGSPHLEEFTRENAAWLGRADGVIWEAGYRDVTGRPTVSLGVKGICYLELTARGASSDLHSSMATLVPNPAWRLTWALATIKDKDERILVEGFYDAVRDPTREDLALLETIPDNSAETASRLGLEGLLLRLTGHQANLRNFFQPTATICGLLSGYTGKGEKTVLPSTAMAKVDFRLVADQDPADIESKVRAHLARQGFDDIEVRAFAGERPARTDPKSPLVGVIRRAMSRVYEQEPVVYPTMTGSGPMPLFTDLGLPVAGFGVGHAGSRVHAPDENISLEDYRLGTELVAALLDGDSWAG
ncbi:MAG: M20/M25/M40 family metallo-hydrolase [Bacillota bacterium]|jgi:acetylornithine deacetylase/succinyl-diaminopimelate desuccinylase-like protein|nr:MAG: M20/M25/M40 family metallo-hydrolase [Bacillota bacterium]